MKQLQLTASAMAALLITAAVSSYGSAAVIVLANRTAGAVDVVLADEATEHPYTLAAEEVRTLRISAATDFWFADDPNSGYRLRGGCAYVFLRDSQDRSLELHRLGLADERGSPDEETEKASDRSAPAASSADKPSSTREDGNVVQVVLAFDTSEPADVESWKQGLRAALDQASQITLPQCGVAFEAAGFQLWRSDPAAASFDEAWRGFVSAVPAEQGKLIVGFTTRQFPQSTCAGFPTTVGPLTSHMLIFADLTPISQRERLEKLLHGFGHYLGAAHSPESDSVMRPLHEQAATDAHATTRFDPINALAMALVGEELATGTPRKLAALSPQVRQRLASVYATLVEAAPQDPLAGRFARLLSPVPIEGPSGMRPTTTITDPHPDVPKTNGVGTTRPPTEAPVGNDDRQTVTDQSRPPGWAETAGGTGAESAPGDQRGLEEKASGLGGETEVSADPFALPKVLALAAVLIAIPAVLLAWRLRSGDGGWKEADGYDAGSLTWQAMASVDRAAWSAYVVSVAGFSVLSAISMLAEQNLVSYPQAGLKAAALLLAVGMGAMSVAPFYPILGPLVYLVLSYAVQGDDPAAARIETSGALTYLPLLAVAGLGVRLLRQRRHLFPPRGGTVWVLLAMMAWIGLSAAGAAISGLPVSSNMVHRVGRFEQVLLLFLVTLYANIGLAELRLTSLLLGLTLFVRVHLFRAEVALEQNLAMLAAIACPLLFVSTRTAPGKLASVGFCLMLGYFVCLIGYGQNRAAMVSLPAAAAVLMLSSRHRGRVLLIAAPVAAILAIWLPSSGFVDRFAEIYQEGEFQGSAYYRLRIWTAGWHMAREHAALGVGPGNFELLIGDYDSELWSIPPHNSFVQMAAETGLPGVALYVVFILMASLALASTVRRYRDDWRGCVAGGILASLAVHVVTGCFLENPSLAATYVGLGIGIALSEAPVTRVYRERLYLPLPHAVAKPLAEFVVQLPRVVSGMPLGRWSAPSNRLPAEEGIEGPLVNSQRRTSTWWLCLLLAFDILSTVAGSLAPFSFQPRDVRAGVDLFYRQMSQGIEFGDRSDWLANAMLFVPLGFLALAACRPRGGARCVMASVLVVTGCLLFSGSIELAQVWFPSRTVNPNDVVAETLGAAAGVVLFLMFGARLVDYAAGAFERRNPLTTIEKVLVCYAVGVIVYVAWPFDFTINPTDFATRLREGRIDFTDWTQPGWFVRAAISAALMVPIGVLLRTAGTRRGQSLRSFAEMAVCGLGWLLAIEFCRLLVYSQSVGLGHLAGEAVGILLGGMARRGGSLLGKPSA